MPADLVAGRPVGPDPAAAGGDVVYGLLALAGVEVALPLAALREVVPCPEEFAELPVSTDGLVGAMTLRKLVVPVLDLRHRLDAGSERRADQVVVIVAQDDQVLGLIADGVRGITRVAGSDLRAVQADGEPLLFSHTFRHPELGGVVSVLHVATVLHLPGIPTVHDPAAAPASTDGPSTPAVTAPERRTLTLLRCGPHVLGVEVAYVHTTLAGSPARPSVLSGALCQGVTDYIDREVPVLDPLVLLGLGQLPVEDAGAGLVLALDHGYVVLAFTCVLDIREVSTADILALPGFSVRRPDLLGGIVDTDDLGQCLVLDGAALMAEPDLRSFASVNTDLGTQGAAGRTTADERTEAATVLANAPAYLTYSVGTDVATLLEQVAEIIPFPTTITRTEVGDAVLGVVVHRRAAVPLLCLATLLGRPRPPVTAASCLLLVQVDGDPVAFFVQELRTIDRLSWREAGTPSAPTTKGDPVRSLRAMTPVCIGGDTRLLPDLDLHALARSVRAEMSGSADLFAAVPAQSGHQVGLSAAG